MKSIEFENFICLIIAPFKLNIFMGSFLFNKFELDEIIYISLFSQRKDAEYNAPVLLAFFISNMQVQLP